MTEPGVERPPPHPLIWLVLYLPYGISNGYVTVTLAWLLSHAGASVAAVAGLAGLGLAANTWKVLWAPVVDVSLTAKRWFLIANAATAATLFAFGLLPLTVAMIPSIGILVMVNAVAGTLTAIATNRMMAYDTTEADKGRAGGWSQAGNLGGVGLGGGAGLWLAQHTGSPALAVAVLAAVSLGCGGALLFLRDPPRPAAGPSYASILVATGRDVLSLARRRIGLLAGFLMLLPIGSGAAQNLWAAVAKDWSANADQVALVGGVLSGLAAIAGCIVGGYVCDRMDRKQAYLLFGAVMAAESLAMALGPRTPLAFMVMATLYNGICGLAYGAYSAVVLESIGQGAAATKFNLISSISNVPLLVVTLVDGWAQSRWGSGGMLIGETVIGLAGIALYVAVAWSTRGLTWARVLGRPAATAG